MRAGMAAWADKNAPCLAAALMAQRPPYNMQRKRLEAERSHQLGKTLCRVERERKNRHLRRRVDGLNNLIDRERERARERVELERSDRILRLRVAQLGEILAQAHR